MTASTATAKVDTYPTGTHLPLVVVSKNLGDIRTILYFAGHDDAEAWLRDALDRVQLAKIDHANTQPAPVYAERESNEGDARIGEPIDLLAAARPSSPTLDRFYADLDAACVGFDRRSDECPPNGIPVPEGAR